MWTWASSVTLASDRQIWQTDAVAVLLGAACVSICSAFPFSRCLDWLSPVFQMHVQKHGVGASLGVTVQQSSFTLVLLLILHKPFPAKSCKTVLMALAGCLLGSQCPGILCLGQLYLAAQRWLEHVPWAWSHPWRCEWEVCSFSSKGHSLDSQELKQPLCTPGESGKAEVLLCLAMLTPALKCQSSTMGILLRGCIFSTASATGWFPVPVHNLCFPARCRVPGAVLPWELASAWGKGQHWDVSHDHGEAQCSPYFPPSIPSAKASSPLLKQLDSCTY